LLAGTGAEAALAVVSGVDAAAPADAFAATLADAADGADAPAAGSVSLFLLHAAVIATAAAIVTTKPNLIRIQ
jgi:hypothetical protein